MLITKFYSYVKLPLRYFIRKFDPSNPTGTLDFKITLFGTVSHVNWNVMFLSDSGRVSTCEVGRLFNLQRVSNPNHSQHSNDAGLKRFQKERMGRALVRII